MGTKATSKRSDYTYARHVAWLQDWLEELDLQNMVLICQDWGGLIGMRLVAANPRRFARVVTTNTMLPTGDHAAGDAFLRWQRYSQDVPVLPVGQIVNKGTVTGLSDAVIAAYDAPFPDESYKEGVRQFPLLVPTTPDNRDPLPIAMHGKCSWGLKNPGCALSAIATRSLPERHPSFKN